MLGRGLRGCVQGRCCLSVLVGVHGIEVRFLGLQVTLPGRVGGPSGGFSGGAGFKHALVRLQPA